jgi:hypothetical protein
MTAELTAKLRVSVWRDYAPSRSLIFRPVGADRHVLLAAEAEANLQQEIYSWSIKDDPFANVGDEGVRLRLRAKLVDAFEPSSHPSERRCNVLREFLADVQSVLAVEKMEWTQSEDESLDEDEQEYLNPLLALYNHLSWLLEMFSEHPGISISIR